MRDYASITAEFVCLMRALGSEDPHAAAFLSRPFRALGAVWRGAAALGLPVDAATLGIRPLVLARHRFIDAALSAALEDGVGQVVLLGAGLDARPWRFAGPEGSPGERRFFVVDHPATARLRARRRLRMPAGLAEASGIRVDVDFAREDFGDALLRAGYRPDLPSFFVWEGVSMYLPRFAVSASLGRLAALMAPGSSLGLDFWRPGAGKAAVRCVEAASRRGMALIGEPVQFGLAVAEISPFLGGHGFRVDALEVPQAGAWSGLTFVHARRR